MLGAVVVDEPRPRVLIGHDLAPQPRGGPVTEGQHDHRRCGELDGGPVTRHRRGIVGRQPLATRNDAGRGGKRRPVVARGAGSHPAGHLGSRAIVQVGAVDEGEEKALRQIRLRIVEGFHRAHRSLARLGRGLADERVVESVDPVADARVGGLAAKGPKDRSGEAPARDAPLRCLNVGVVEHFQDLLELPRLRAAHHGGVDLQRGLPRHGLLAGEAIDRLLRPQAAVDDHRAEAVREGLGVGVGDAGAVAHAPEVPPGVAQRDAHGLHVAHDLPRAEIGRRVRVLREAIGEDRAGGDGVLRPGLLPIHRAREGQVRIGHGAAPRQLRTAQAHTARIPHDEVETVAHLPGQVRVDELTEIDSRTARATGVEGETAAAARRWDHAQRDLRRAAVIRGLPVQRHRELRALGARRLHPIRAIDVGKRRLEGRRCRCDREAGQAGREEAEGGDEGGEWGAHASDGTGQTHVTGGNAAVGAARGGTRRSSGPMQQRARE